MKFAGRLLPYLKGVLPQTKSEWALELAPNLIGAAASGILAPPNASGLERAGMATEDLIGGALLDFGLRAATRGGMKKGARMMGMDTSNPDFEGKLNMGSLLASNMGSMGLYMTGMVPRPIANNVYERFYQDQELQAQRSQELQIQQRVEEELLRRMNPVAATAVTPYATPLMGSEYGLMG